MQSAKLSVKFLAAILLSHPALSQINRFIELGYANLNAMEWLTDSADAELIVARQWR